MHTKFKLIRENNENDFEEAVNEALADGWVLQGNLVVNETDDWTFFTQAMTLTEYDV